MDSHHRAQEHYTLQFYYISLISIRNKMEWDSIAEAVNAVGSEDCTVTKKKKKWSDMKVDIKQQTAALRQSVARIGVEELTLFG